MDRSNSKMTADVGRSADEDLAEKRTVIETRIERLLEQIGGALSRERKERLFELTLAELNRLASRLERAPTVTAALLLLVSSVIESTRKSDI